jgi:hypothetical protein
MQNGIVHWLVLIVFVNQFTLCGMNSIKMVHAQQAAHHSTNTKEKLLKSNTAVWFNKK